MADYRALPPLTVAALVGGLRVGSRLGIGGPTVDQLLAARAADEAALLRWMLSEAGARGENRPESLSAILSGQRQEPQRLDGFGTPEELMAAMAAARGE